MMQSSCLTAGLLLWGLVSLLVLLRVRVVFLRQVRVRVVLLASRRRLCSSPPSQAAAPRRQWAPWSPSRCLL